MQSEANLPETSGATPLPISDRRALIAGLGGIAAGAFLAGARTAQAGPLNPPGGPVAPTGRTTQEIFDAVNSVGTSVTSDARRGWIPVGPSTTPGAGNALYVITQPGYYYLTGPISVSSPTYRYGIRLDVGGVTLDLNGHRVSANGVNCTAIGSPALSSNRHLRNGFIVATSGALGIEGAGLRSVIEDLTITAEFLGSMGLDLAGGSGSLIRRCRFYGNPAEYAIAGTTADGVTIEDVIIDGVSFSLYGVQLRNTATLRRCIIRACGLPCVSAGEGAVVEDCVIGPTFGSGIVVGDRSTISNCTVDRTGNIGIDAGSQCVVQRCRSTTNTTGGIRVVTSCLVRECFVDFHPNNLPQYGIKSTGNATQIVDNVIGRCWIGIDFQGVSGCVAMRNLGRSNTNNISISGGGNWYPFVDFGTLNTATNPFANLFT